MDLAVLRAHLDACGESVVVTESWTPEDHAWCGGRAHEFVIPLAATTTPDPPPKILARRGPLPSVGRGHGHLPGSGSVLSARLYSDPALFDTIVTEQLPDLADGWDDLLLWWFIRYRDPRHHLRLRLHVADYGKAAARIGKWAAALREQGLIGDLVLDTYRPEVGRFGDGPVLGAAEALFAADSAAAATQLANTSSVDPQALTAASLVDLAGAILGERDAGLSWLVAHPRPASPEPMDRDARRQVLAMTGPDGTAPAVVRTAWRARADAAAAYARLLAGSGRSPAGVIESLLHLHHNRVHGPGSAAESATYRLARAAALAHAAQTAGRGKGCPS
jgi:thiopeptide-type bacteriocin biosynthesis protein